MKREKYLHYFENKEVTVLGLGLLGRQIGDTAFLASCGAHIVVTDKKTEEELASSCDQLKQFPDITYHLGGHVTEDFEKKDFVLKAAGVAIDNDYILHAKKCGVPVYMSAALLSQIVVKEVSDVTIIGVTGTRGKSTTTQLIAHILREAGNRVHMAGNIRGIANLPVLEVIDDGDFLVLELDSWQLQGFADVKISPHIAVFTSFLDDHMNYYKDDKEAYFNDKAAIYRFQDDYDVLIASAQAAREIQQRDPKKSCIVPESVALTTQLIGEHNQTAVQLAYEAATQCGIDDETIRTAIASFIPVEGRLQDMGIFSVSTDKEVRHTIRVFNDNNATTPDACVAGIKAIIDTYHRKPILITGGADKGLPKNEYEKYLVQYVQDVVFLAGTGTDTITIPKTYVYERLEDCIRQAFALAQDGDIILFSPAFASFSKYFNNEYERNDLFVKEVEKYR